MRTASTAKVREGSTAGADVVRAIGQVVGAVAAAVGVIYVLGGLIIWLRLLLVSKPQLAIVAELPREVVISVGLVVVALALGVGAVHGFWRLVVRLGDETPPRRGAPSSRRYVAELGALLAVPTWFVFLFAEKWDDRWVGNLWIGHWSATLLAATVAWLFACIWALTSIQLRDRLGETYWDAAKELARDEQIAEADEASRSASRDADEARTAAKNAQDAADHARETAERTDNEEDQKRAAEFKATADKEDQRAKQTAARAKQEADRLRDLTNGKANGSPDRVEEVAIDGFNTSAAVAVTSALWAAVSVPAFLVAAATLPLAEARACVAGRPAFEGEFIGGTSDRVYLTDARGDRIASLPLDDLTLLYVGDEARGDTDSTDAPCPPSSTPSP